MRHPVQPRKIGAQVRLREHIVDEFDTGLVDNRGLGGRRQLVVSDERLEVLLNLQAKGLVVRGRDVEKPDAVLPELAEVGIGEPDVARTIEMEGPRSDNAASSARIFSGLSSTIRISIGSVAGMQLLLSMPTVYLNNHALNMLSS